jgi:hypothetical protein
VAATRRIYFVLRENISRNFARRVVLYQKAMQNRNPEPNESLWRRKTTAAERAGLRGQPELEMEARLTDALARLKDPPAPSNFTARVMAAIELEEAQAARLQGRRWNWRFFLPRLAVTAAVVLFAVVGLQEHEAGQRRVEMTRSLSQVASAEAVPSVEVLKNFDAIQRMSQSGHADTELLAALQ